MTRIAVLGLVLGANAARADENQNLSITGRGDHVEIVARGVTVKEGVHAWARGVWIDLALATAPVGNSRISVANDRTVKRVDLVKDGEQPRLSVLLHHDMNSADYLGNTTVEQTAAGLVVRVPREPDHKPVPFVAPADAPQYGPQPAARVALPPAPARTPVVLGSAVAPAARTVEHPVLATRPAPTAPVALAAQAQKPAATPIAMAAVGAEPFALLDERSASSSTHTALFLTILLLSASGIVVLLVARRRRATANPQQLLRVVSSCQLSPKVRVVLVTVGDRELLLSVGDSGAAVLGRWKPGRHAERLTLELGAEEQAEEAATLAESMGEPRQSRQPEMPEIDIDIDLSQTFAPPPPPAPPMAPSYRPGPSPAVAGLLKLRRRDAEEVASGDPVADELWARELLAAMRGVPEVVR